jgi:hypothetical protein
MVYNCRRDYYFGLINNKNSNNDDEDYENSNNSETINFLPCNVHFL